MKKLYKIKKSKIDNRGLYAATNIKKNTKIIEYKGKIITVKETENIIINSRTKSKSNDD